MIEKTFNIYCDESTHLEHDGHPYMLYGYVSIASNQIKICKEQMEKPDSVNHLRGLENYIHGIETA